MFGDEEMNNKYVVRLFYFLIIYFFYFLFFARGVCKASSLDKKKNAFRIRAADFLSSLQTVLGIWLVCLVSLHQLKIIF